MHFWNRATARQKTHIYLPESLRFYRHPTLPTRYDMHAHIWLLIVEIVPFFIGLMLLTHMVLWGTWQQRSRSCLVCKPLQRAHTLLRPLWRYTCDSWGLRLKRHFKLELIKDWCSGLTAKAGGGCCRHQGLSVDSVENEWQTHRLKTAAPQREPRPRTSSCPVVQPKGKHHIMPWLGMKGRRKARMHLPTSSTRLTQVVPVTEARSTTLFIFILPASSWQHPINSCVSKVYLLSASRRVQGLQFSDGLHNICPPFTHRV